LLVSVVSIAAEQTAEAEPPPRSDHRRLFWALTLAILVCVGLFAAHGWYQGGTRVEMDGAGLGVHPVPVGSDVSFGVGLTTRGGRSVVVDAAMAKHSANVDLHFAIIRTGPGQLGIGTSDGTIVGATPIGARGIRVAQPGFNRAPTTCTTAGPVAPAQCKPVVSPSDDEHTWLVVTVTPRSPGPWSVTQITVRYHSWWRTRTATSRYVDANLAFVADATRPLPSVLPVGGEEIPKTCP
jgi:hypothetical protein